MGDKKKSPNSNHAHRTTSHKTEHHWEKMGSHGGNLDCRGGGAALEKRQPPQWEPDGLCALKWNPRLAALGGSGAGGALPLAPPYAEGTWGWGWGVAGSEAVTEPASKTPGSWLRVSDPLTLPRCLPARCQNFQIRSISRSSTVLPPLFCSFFLLIFLFAVYF